ncbi:S1/P1 nuclease [Anaeromyxobacter oryzae]|uniref:Endonuclease n=1 Tax=Anaeromyxobacter oryzae TaxID=2918170 RepID=A0ABN6MV72_9BACT|nr:S1/P1 nuclease [Anaeromyxobacter oryzae]BDG04426.1 endonuclease [Anaeromyxobacter oryzae]
MPRSARRLAAPLAAVALALAAPGRAGAWSEPGHRIVAHVAEARLSPAARRLVRDVLGDRRLADVAAWADEQGDRATRPWHYVNVPFAAAGYEPARDCPRGDCVVAAIERSAARLRDGTTDLDRADALRWLVHLVADAHQPLHAGDGRDRGGNELEVRFAHRRHPVTFHHVWDAEVVAPLLGSRTPREIALALGARIRPADAAAWTATLAPAAWADESAALARALYGELGIEPRPGAIVTLPRGYAREQRARVEARLEAAGVRLAAVLDRISAEREAHVRAAR